MAYVDGFVIPVPKKNVEEYLAFARQAGAVWKECGALEYRECIGDDAPPGEVTSFPLSVKLEPDETVGFAWIVYRDRKHRDEVNAKAMKDPRIANQKPEDLPFDGKRMIFGGFEMKVDL
jgi:uncharacterized protein YbaA (DUF1428 family)